MNASVAPSRAQPANTAPAPIPRVVEDATERRAGYLGRLQEMLAWRAGLAKRAEPATFNLQEIAAKLARREDADICSARIVELMKKPASDMFWMI